MADEIDSAQRMDELYRTSAVVKTRALYIEDDEPLIINGVRCCLDCEKPIPLARLELQPNARRCVKCQGKKEKRHVQKSNKQ